MENIEVCYIIPIWKNNSLEKLSVAPKKQDIIYDSAKRVYYTNSETYPEAKEGFIVLGFSITSPLIHTPYFEAADKKKIELEKLKDPITGRIWWTEKRIDLKSRHHIGTLFKTAGKVNLIIQEKRLVIHNDTFSFTYDELERYLADFKGELYKLILNNASIATGNIRKGRSLITNEDLSIYKNFVLNLESLVKKPSICLRESLEKRSINKIKPLSKTFREYSINPNAKEYSSRVHSESLDTPENRYIHHLINRVILILDTTLSVSKYQKEIFQKYIKTEESLENLFKIPRKTISSKVFENELQLQTEEVRKIKEKLYEINTYLSSKTQSDYSKRKSFIATIGKPYGKSNRQFFLTNVDGKQNPKTKYKYWVIEFPYDFSEISYFISNNAFAIEISYGDLTHKNDAINSSGEIFYLLKISVLYSFKPYQLSQFDELERLQKRKLALIQNNWLDNWSREEKVEREKELEKIKNNKQIYSENLRKYDLLAQSIPTILVRLKSLKRIFTQNHVKPQPNCPNSMVFIQNPTYAFAKASYAEIATLGGFNEPLYHAIEAIEEIGLIEIPYLYEKWCLLQIINILNSVYEFQLKDNWMEPLLRTVNQTNSNAEIEFEEDEREQRITLHYEKELPNGRKPDFILELNSHRLVLDAKFRPLTEEKSIELIDELYYEKNYSEDRENQVFILHPTKNTIVNETSPLPWGKTCDYGQSNTIQHKKGSIYLNPTQTENTLENLQRLIGMFIQQHTDIVKAYETQKSKMLATCIHCGNHSKENLIIFQKATKGSNKKYKYTINCRLCSQTTIKTHCYGGDYNSIFKNGDRWTYHRTRAEEIYNVVCPKCEKFFKQTKD